MTEEALGLRRRQRVKRRTVVAAEPRKQRQIVRADKHVDAVDLEQAEPADRVRERGGADIGCAGHAVKTLGRQRDAAGFRGARFLPSGLSPSGRRHSTISNCIWCRLRSSAPGHRFAKRPLLPTGVKAVSGADRRLDHLPLERMVCARTKSKAKCDRRMARAMRTYRRSTRPEIRR